MTKFQVTALDGKARNGKLITPRGEVLTPVYLPVGTQATVKAVTPEQVKAIGAEMILSNTYHLYLRPGADTVFELGGLHKFMNWDRPILTDSGGFQVFSLGFGVEHQVGKIFRAGEEDLVLGDFESKDVVVRTKLCKVEEEGPTFQSHIDGSVHFFSPEVSVDVQVKLGSDFIVALDECTSPLHDYDYTKNSMERSHRWEKRSLEAAPEHNMFGVIQGGPFEDLRIESTKFVSKNDFFGVGIGGALVSRQKMVEILDWIYPHLDSSKPRHLLGIGTVPDIFLAVERGVDMFDCVAPTRIARNGRLLVRRGHIDITKAEFRADPSPIEFDCDCYTCQNYSRAYVHQLFKAHELLAYTLSTIHNLRFMSRLMSLIRESINEGRFLKLKAEWLQDYET